MSQVPDRNTRRQEYLRKKRQAYVKVAVGLIVGVPMALAFAGMALSAVNAFGIYECYGSGTPPYAAAYRPYLKWFYGFSALSLLTAGLTWYSTKAFEKGMAEVKCLPYVPPVTAETLPADEILVRGSEAPPVVQSEILLRAATGQETAKEELLRMSQDNK